MRYLKNDKGTVFEVYDVEEFLKHHSDDYFRPATYIEFEDFKKDQDIYVKCESYRTFPEDGGYPECIGVLKGQFVNGIKTEIKIDYNKTVFLNVDGIKRIFYVGKCDHKGQMVLFQM